MSESTSKENKLKQLNEKLNAMMQKKGLSLAQSLPTKTQPKKEIPPQSQMKQEQRKQKQPVKQQKQQSNMPKKTKKIQKPQNKQKLQRQQKNKNLRKIAGIVWEDKTMEDWPDNDYRIFVGNMGKQVNDNILSNVFRARYPSFNMARVVIDRRTGLSRGYGFVSFAQPRDFLNALKQMNGQYVGNRPVKVMKSNWKERNIDSASNQILPSDFRTNSKKETHKIHVDYKYQHPI